MVQLRDTLRFSHSGRWLSIGESELETDARHGRRKLADVGQGGNAWRALRRQLHRPRDLGKHRTAASAPGHDTAQRSDIRVLVDSDEVHRLAAPRGRCTPSGNKAPGLLELPEPRTATERKPGSAAVGHVATGSPWAPREQLVCHAHLTLAGRLQGHVGRQQHGPGVLRTRRQPQAPQEASHVPRAHMLGLLVLQEGHQVLHGVVGGGHRGRHAAAHYCDKPCKQRPQRAPAKYPGAVGRQGGSTAAAPCAGSAPAQAARRRGGGWGHTAMLARAAPGWWRAVGTGPGSDGGTGGL